MMPPAAADEGREKEARTPRAPARGLRPPAPPEWVTHIVTPNMSVHRTLWMRAAGAPTRDTMYLHSKGHEVGTPYTPC